ncbi:MAG: hypothetical protein R3F34_09995 [Planctomycetota bacterium]
MHAWVFRHRHGLRSIYGLPPEPRLAPLLQGADRRAERSSGRRAARADADVVADELEDARVPSRVPRVTIKPKPRRA